MPKLTHNTNSPMTGSDSMMAREKSCHKAVKIRKSANAEEMKYIIPESLTCVMKILNDKGIMIMEIKKRIRNMNNILLACLFSFSRSIIKMILLKRPAGTSSAFR